MITDERWGPCVAPPRTARFAHLLVSASRSAPSCVRACAGSARRNAPTRRAVRPSRLRSPPSPLTAYITSAPRRSRLPHAMGCSASCERALRAELAEEEALYARLARSLPAAPHGALHARSRHPRLALTRGCCVAALGAHDAPVTQPAFLSGAAAVPAVRSNAQACGGALRLTSCPFVPHCPRFAQRRPAADAFVRSRARCGHEAEFADDGTHRTRKRLDFEPLAGARRRPAAVF